MAGNIPQRRRAGISRTCRYTLSALSVLLLCPAPGAAMDKTEPVFTYFEAEQLEYRLHDGADIMAWDAQGWAGTDDHKLAFKTEGEKAVNGGVEAAEAQFLYKRLISDFFDLQAGLRHDFSPDPDRTHAVLGIQGLAPYFFEIDANLFVSGKGDVSARLEAEYEILLTQKLILQPAAELDIAFSEDRPTGTGAGIGSLELGLRLRYEIIREFAPYMGLHWEKLFGQTAGLARAEGEGTNNLFFATGLRFWF